MNENTKETAEGPHISPLEKGVLVRHVGLNRKERRAQERTMRLDANGTEAKNRARSLLSKTPKNYPVRPVIVNGTPMILPEPVYQQLVAEYAELEAKRQASAYDEMVNQFAEIAKLDIPEPNALVVDMDKVDPEFFREHKHEFILTEDTDAQ
jgi:hypothetical protein